MFCYNYNANILSLLEIKYNIQNSCIFNTTMSIHCWCFFLIFRIYFIFFLWKRGGGPSYSLMYLPEAQLIFVVSPEYRK